MGFTEYELLLTDVAGGEASSVWALTGFVLGLGGTGLWIYNACDENGLQAGLPPQDAGRHRQP